MRRGAFNREDRQLRGGRQNIGNIPVLPVRPVQQQMVEGFLLHRDIGMFNDGIHIIQQPQPVQRRVKHEVAPTLCHRIAVGRSVERQYLAALAHHLCVLRA